MRIEKKKFLGIAGGILAVVGAALASGCANVQRGKGFDDVAREVSERTGAKVHWDNGTEADAEVEKSVEEMLGKELTADEAVQIALLNNHELQAVYEELNIAQADVVQAGLLKNPVFSGEVRFATSGGGTGVVLDVAQDFLSVLWLPMRKGIAETGFEATKIRVTNAVLDTVYETKMAFYEYQAAEQMREMRETVMEVTGASHELAKRLREAGNNREMDVLNEQALHEQAKLDLEEAETSAMMMREWMNSLMGLWRKQTEWKAATRLAEIPEKGETDDGLEGKAIEASLELAELRREAEMRARELGMTKGLAWMDGAEVGAAAEQEVEGGWSVGPAFAVPIPIFDMGQGERAKAEAEMRQVEARYWARAVKIRSRVRAVAGAMNAARDRAEYLKEVILPLRERILEETQAQYNAMQVSAFELLQAKREQIGAGAEYVDSLRGYWQSRTTLEQILHGGRSEIERLSGASGMWNAENGTHAGGQR